MSKSNEVAETIAWGVVNLVTVVAVVAILLFLVALPPLAVIWAINTLFPAAAIPFNSWTVLAAFLILWFFRISRRGGGS